MHPTQEETFTGVSGYFVLEIDGQARTIGPGDRISIPPRTPHGFPEASQEAHLLVEVRPALHTDDYFRAFLGLSRDRRISMPVKGLPYPLLLVAILLDRFAPEIAASGIPIGLQRPVWRLLAAVARWRGLSASFPEYGAP